MWKWQAIMSELQFEKEHVKTLLYNVVKIIVIWCLNQINMNIFDLHFQFSDVFIFKQKHSLRFTLENDYEK